MPEQHRSPSVSYHFASKQGGIIPTHQTSSLAATYDDHPDLKWQPTKRAKLLPEFLQLLVKVTLDTLQQGNYWLLILGWLHTLEGLPHRNELLILHRIYL